MNVTETCCSITDLRGLQKWWEEPISSSTDSDDSNSTFSRNQIRKRKLENISAFVIEVLLKTDEIMRVANKFIISTVSDEFCQTTAKSILNFLRQFKYTDLVEKFEEESDRCWEFTNELQISLMCSVCDPKAQNFLNFENNEVLVNQDTFKKFSQKCKRMVNINTQQLYPYFDILSKFATCDFEGKLTGKREPEVTMGMNQELFEGSSMADLEEAPK